MATENIRRYQGRTMRCTDRRFIMDGWTLQLDNGPTDLTTGNMSKKPFRELTFGTKFTFHGKTYVKIALNMAEDEKRHGHIFMYEMGVEPIERTLGQNLKPPHGRTDG